MKRTLQNFLFMTLVFIGITSCSDDDVNYEKDVPVVVRFANETSTINVDDEIVFDIPVQLSRPIETDVTVKYEVISNTMVENEDFTDLSQGEVVIPIGEVVGRILFSSEDGVYDDGGKSFIVKITEVVGNAEVSATTLSYPSLQVIFNGCPSVTVPNNMFVGDYKIERQNQEVGPFDIPAFEDGVVQLVAVEDNVRSFSVDFYPGAGIGQPAMDFMFKFDICGDVTVFSEQETYLGCSGSSILIGPSDNVGSYEFAPLNDDSFSVVFVEFEKEACGVTEPFENTYIFTKQ